MRSTSRRLAVTAAAAALSLTGLTLTVSGPAGAARRPVPVPVPITVPPTPTTAAPPTTTAPASTTTMPMPPTTVAPPQAGPMCPAASPNGRFVRFIYMWILQRCPDPAAATYWTGRLDGGMDRWAFADYVDMSDENIINNNVVSIFQEGFHRAPTADELSTWSANIRATHGDAELLAHILSSDETYSSLPPGDKVATWLGIVYNAVLDRDPDPAGLAYFSGILNAPGANAATRYTVAMALEHSAENAGDWTGAVYGAAFGRAPDPAIGYWIGWLQGEGHWRTFAMWTMFLSSPEGYALAQTQPNPAPEEH